MDFVDEVDSEAGFQGGDFGDAAVPVYGGGGLHGGCRGGGRGLLGG